MKSESPRFAAKQFIANGLALCYQGVKPLVVFGDYNGQSAIGCFMETEMEVLICLNSCAE